MFSDECTKANLKTVANGSPICLGRALITKVAEVFCSLIGDCTFDKFWGGGINDFAVAYLPLRPYLKLCSQELLVS